MPNLIVSAVSTFDNKGLKKGRKEVSAFEKQVKSFGKVFAGVFSATALFNYSKKAVQAFAEDEKAAKALEIQLRNTGFAFAAPEVENYIANLQRTTGVLDDQLRPAFQQLLTVTGSVSKSQEALNTALNISAATGKSLTEVSAALTRGFSGNTTGLSRLGAGISKATLKAGKMEDILAELNQKFAGQAAARLDTYAGKMDLLKVAAADASEIIGKGLLDSLALLGKDKNIENVSNAMTELATDIADITVGISLLVSKFTGLLESLGLKDISIKMLYGPLATILKQLGETERTKPTSNFTYGLGSSATKDIERVKEIMRLKSSNKLRQDEINKMKAKSEVDKLEEKFNVERIGLLKALGEATDAETKLRLQSKLAILDNNEALAKKYNAELNAKTAADLLAQAGKNAAESLNTLPGRFDDVFKRVYEQSIALGNDVAGARAMAGQSARLTAEAEAFANGTGRYAQPLNPIYGPSTTPTSQGNTYIDMTLNTGAVLSSNQDLERYIQDALGNITKLGNGALVPAGSIAFQ